MREEVKDVAIRSAKTFWQGAVAYLLVAFGSQLGTIDIFSLEGLQKLGVSLLSGAVAAGLSAEWNGVIQPTLDKMKGVDE